MVFKSEHAPFEELQKTLAGKFLLDNPETMRHGGYLVNKLGVFLSNVRVKMLKVIMLRFPS